MKRLFLIIFVIFVSSIYAVAVELPKGVEKHLDKNYPDWTLAESCCETGKKPIAVGDFDGNKKKDYAVAIKAKDGKIYVLAFLKRGKCFQAFLIRKPKGMKVCLSIVKKGELVPLTHLAHEPLKLENDAIFLEDCEFFEEGGTFYFKNDMFEWVPPLD